MYAESKPKVKKNSENECHRNVTHLKVSISRGKEFFCWIAPPGIKVFGMFDTNCSNYKQNASDMYDEL